MLMYNCIHLKSESIIHIPSHESATPQNNDTGANFVFKNMSPIDALKGIEFLNTTGSASAEVGRIAMKAGADKEFVDELTDAVTFMHFEKEFQPKFKEVPGSRIAGEPAKTQLTELPAFDTHAHAAPPSMN